MIDEKWEAVMVSKVDIHVQVSYSDRVCSMSGFSYNDPEALEKTKRRAHLIAAAPDMLQALRSVESDLMAYVDRLYKDGPRMIGSFNEAKVRLEKLRAAIDKAREPV